MFALGTRIPLQDDLIAVRIGLGQADALRRLAIDTYSDTFAHLNTPENLQAYLDSAFHPDRVAAELGDARNAFFLIEKRGSVIGYLKLVDDVDAQDDTIPAIVRERPSLLIERFYVIREHQGAGVASVLMQFCVDVARTLGKSLLWLGVWEANPRAIAFYTKQGFVLGGTHVFVMGDDAQTDYWMVREIDPSSSAI